MRASARLRRRNLGCLTPTAHPLEQQGPPPSMPKILAIRSASTGTVTASGASRERTTGRVANTAVQNDPSRSAAHWTGL